MELQFTFSEEEANDILNSLGDTSFKISAPIIQKMQSQAKPQLDKRDAKKSDIVNSDK